MSARHDGRDARSWLDDIREDTRATRDLSRRNGLEMRMGYLQTAGAWR